MGIGFSSGFELFTRSLRLMGSGELPPGRSVPGCDQDAVTQLMSLRTVARTLRRLFGFRAFRVFRVLGF